ncbi:hypothetical protein [Methyloglobulus sp.]|uniref:hypothetical protein n=1 Tax=Methyloglobulus sp. TaxID=2518622 RepID=UPI0032B80C39
MQILKLSYEPARANRLNNHPAKKDDSLLGLFPKPQYFQVHFQHLHEHNQQLHEELAQLKDTVAKTDEKLGRLLALLSGKSVMG